MATRNFRSPKPTWHSVGTLARKRELSQLVRRLEEIAARD